MNNKLATERSIRLFFKYLVPSMLSTVFVSVYIITDTMMIGHGVGENGLVALNILLPVFSVFYATGYLLGVGGSVLMAVAKGKREDKEADSIFSTSLTVILIIGILFTIFGGVFLMPVARVLGATKNNITLVKEYGVWLMGTAFIYVLSPFFQCFVRNDNAPSRAMSAAVAGSLINVVLDYIFIFIFDMGMTGAIVATVIGNAANVIITSTHLLSKKNTMHFKISNIEINRIGTIMKNGLSGFLAELSNGVVVLAFNRSILMNIGNEGIVIYSVISNTAIVVYSLFTGVANAVQPLVSYNYGAALKKRVESFKKIGIITEIIYAVILYTFLYFGAKLCIYAFVKPTSTIIGDGVPAIRIYFSGILFAGINVLTASYMQAVIKPIQSFVIGMMRGLILPSVLAFVVPVLFGGKGIWWAIPVTEIITIATSILYLIKYKEK